MIIDIIVLIAALFAAYRGYNKGIVTAILSFIGLLVGAIISLKLSHTFASYLSEKNIINNQYVLLVSFIILFISSILLFRFINNAIIGLLKLAMLGWANKLVGAALYIFMSMFFVSAQIWLCNKVNLLSDTTKQESKTYNYMEPIAPKTINFVSQYTPYFKDLIGKINAYTAQFQNKK